MRVLMFGWEFPPYVSGGLGVACEGLVRGLVELGTEVALVLPRRSPPSPLPNLRLISSEAAELSRPRPRGKRLRVRRVSSPLRPYLTAEVYAEQSREAERLGMPFAGLYGPDLPREVLRYAGAAARLAARERFDVIHAHDWLTFLAGIEARQATGRPLVLHVHATEFDRAGGGENGFVAAVERLGLQAADRVVAVSSYTADIVAREYDVGPERIRIVHNAIDAKESVGRWAVERWTLEGEEPLVLFAGRITWQKGPEYFVDAAARVAA